MPAPVVEAPPEAIDKLYAQSLFELAESQGGRALLEELYDEMEQLEDVRARDPKVAEFFRSLLIPGDDKVAVLRKGLHGRVNPLLEQFMLLLAHKDRFDRLWRIFHAFEDGLQERFGKVEVDIYTRYPMTADEQKAIGVALHQAMKREPVVHAYVDESMIGGLRIHVGDKMLDASVDAQLRKMREKMMIDGSSTLRERLDHMYDE